MSRFVHAPLLLAALLALGAGSAQADGVETQGAGALMFDYGGLFTSTPTALDGVGIGGRYFLNKSFAIRAGLGVLLDTEKVEAAGASEESGVTQLGIEVGGEFVLARTRSAFLYSGGLLQLSKFERDPEGASNNVDRFDLTIAALLGVTYFIVEGLSIGAEYRFGLNYGAQTEERPGQDNIESTRVTIGVGTVGFHLGFWFD